MRLGIRHLLVAVASLLAAQLAMAAGISGSKHDFSTKGWGSSELCIFCHTPHNANGSAQLWNHASTVATYTLYTSSTLNATTATPGETSKLCLSCHDGTVAIDSFGTRTGTITIGAGAGANPRANLTTALDNDHPIGFLYDAALATADGALVAPLDTKLVVASVPLYTGKVECGSCHNVHDPVNVPFLRVPNTGSALCLKCHVK